MKRIVRNVLGKKIKPCLVTKVARQTMHGKTQATNTQQIYDNILSKKRYKK